MPTSKRKRNRVSLRAEFPKEDSTKLLQKMQEMNLNTTGAGFRIQFDLEMEKPLSRTVIQSALDCASMNKSNIQTIQKWLKLAK